MMTVAALGVHLSSYGPDQIGPTLMNLALALFPIVFLVFGPVVVVVAVARIPVSSSTGAGRFEYRMAMMHVLRFEVAMDDLGLEVDQRIAHVLQYGDRLREAHPIAR